jgi:hypothetical protein
MHVKVKFMCRSLILADLCVHKYGIRRAISNQLNIRHDLFPKSLPVRIRLDRSSVFTLDKDVKCLDRSTVVTRITSLILWLQLRVRRVAKLDDWIGFHVYKAEPRQTIRKHEHQARFILGIIVGLRSYRYPALNKWYLKNTLSTSSDDIVNWQHSSLTFSKTWNRPD